jgi:hypothetical protein
LNDKLLTLANIRRIIGKMNNIIKALAISLSKRGRFLGEAVAPVGVA